MLAASGVAVLVPELRGHGANRPHGDIAYERQLEDDLADMIHALQGPGSERRLLLPGPWTLAGFSSGGGFALKIAGGPLGRVFDWYLPTSPYLQDNAPTDAPTEQPPSRTTGQAAMLPGTAWPRGGLWVRLS